MEVNQMEPFQKLLCYTVQKRTWSPQNYSACQGTRRYSGLCLAFMHIIFCIEIGYAAQLLLHPWQACVLSRNSDCLGDSVVNKLLKRFLLILIATELQQAGDAWDGTDNISHTSVPVYTYSIHYGTYIQYYIPVKAAVIAGGGRTDYG